MINMRMVLSEDRDASVDRGCLMAMVDEKNSKLLTEFNHKLIPDDILYVKDGEFGRETECHVTIKYGFLPDLNEMDIRRILKEQGPFIVQLKSISIFENEEFDVVKFDVESPTIKRLNHYASQYPNDDKYPEYHPHMTIAYVKPGSFNKVKTGLQLYIPIKQVCYSPIKGGKSYFDL